MLAPLLLMTSPFQQRKSWFKLIVNVFPEKSELELPKVIWELFAKPTVVFVPALDVLQLLLFKLYEPDGDPNNDVVPLMSK
jgi:hypothetical protein